MISPEAAQDKLIALGRAMSVFLSMRCHDWSDAVTALADAQPHSQSGGVPGPARWPELSPVIGSELIITLNAAREALYWQQNPAYLDADFLPNYRYCELLGPGGHARDDACALGLLYLDAHTHYPAHSHPAEEVYLPLSEASEWRTAGTQWQSRQAGERIDHPSGTAHEMRTGAAPLLAVYLWRGDVETKARLL